MNSSVSYFIQDAWYGYVVVSFSEYMSTLRTVRHLSVPGKKCYCIDVNNKGFYKSVFLSRS